MPSVNRNQLLPHWHKMVKQGGFWGKIAESAMLADEPNLETLVTAFPKLIEGQAYERPRWTPQLYIYGTQAKLAR